MHRGGTAGTLAFLASCSLTSLDGYSSGSDAGAPAPTAEAGADVTAPTVDGGRPDHAPVTPRTCRETKEAMPGAVDGIFMTPDGDRYCDMTTDGGGWTLVARTGESAESRFGWNVARGSLDDEVQPYSIDVLATGLPFDEILIGARQDSGKKLANGYKLAVSRAQVLASDNQNVTGYAITTVLGDCAPPKGPAMLRHLGFTSFDDHYRFRDVPQKVDVSGGKYGLFSDRFGTAYDDCEAGGHTNGRPGMIFVR